jgi:hypothetical protein
MTSYKLQNSIMKLPISGVFSTKRGYYTFFFFFLKLRVNNLHRIPLLFSSIATACSWRIIFLYFTTESRRITFDVQKTVGCRSLISKEGIITLVRLSESIVSFNNFWIMSRRWPPSYRGYHNVKIRDQMDRMISGKLDLINLSPELLPLYLLTWGNKCVQVFPSGKQINKQVLTFRRTEEFAPTPQG